MEVFAAALIQSHQRFHSGSQQPQTPTSVSSDAVQQSILRCLSLPCASRDATCATLSAHPGNGHPDRSISSANMSGVPEGLPEIDGSQIVITATKLEGARKRTNSGCLDHPRGHHQREVIPVNGSSLSRPPPVIQQSEAQIVQTMLQQYSHHHSTLLGLNGQQIVDLTSALAIMMKTLIQMQHHGSPSQTDQYLPSNGKTIRLEASPGSHVHPTMEQSIGASVNSSKKRRRTLVMTEPNTSRRLMSETSLTNPQASSFGLEAPQKQLEGEAFLTTGSFPLSHPDVDHKLSRYQAAIRRHIEVFVVEKQSVSWIVRGRKRPVVLGQVGLRCKHCRSLPAYCLEKGASYFPVDVHGVYQAAQNIARSHLLGSCKSIGEKDRESLRRLQAERKPSASGGKEQWMKGFVTLGICQAADGQGLRMRNPTA